VKKIEVDYGAFYPCATAIAIIFWIILSVFTELSVFAALFLTLSLSYILVKISVLYIFEIK
jgi:hypothetical protein